MKINEYKQVENGIEYDIKETAFFRNWYLNGKRHRLKGPALEDLLYEEEDDECDSYHSWYYNGELIDCSSQEEFERILKLKAFL